MFSVDNPSSELSSVGTFHFKKGVNIKNFESKKFGGSSTLKTNKDNQKPLKAMKITQDINDILSVSQLKTKHDTKSKEYLINDKKIKSVKNGVIKEQSAISSDDIKTRLVIPDGVRNHSSMLNKD